LAFLRLREVDARATDARLLATLFLRAGLLTLALATLPAARLIAGAERVSFDRPVVRASAVFCNTTSVAAFAAAPIASPATVFTPLALHCAAFAIACLALVLMFFLAICSARFLSHR
jgi:hypothetical protein